MENTLTIKEAILLSMKDLKKICTSIEIYNHILKNKYYTWEANRTPARTIAAELGNFIRKNDTRVKRIPKNDIFLYYLSELESSINFDDIKEVNLKNEIIIEKRNKKDFDERDLHILFSTYLSSININSKTIFHERSTSVESQQKWMHPDMVGVQFLDLHETTKNLSKLIDVDNLIKIYSYEIKKSINSDYELKKCYFQAVSNSSWANYGYLVSYEINNNLYNEIERLNESFGIGVIELNPYPYESKVIVPSALKKLDFRTIDKLIKINSDFRGMIQLIEKQITAEEKYRKLVESELLNYCDSWLKSDNEIENYCKEKGIVKPEEND